MSVSPELADFVARIFDADHEDLDLIAKAVGSRRRYLKEMHAHEMEGTVYTGDYVTIQNVKTGYLNGCRGEVKEVGDKVTVYIVEVDNSESVHMANSRALWKEFTVPFSCVTKDC